MGVSYSRWRAHGILIPYPIKPAVLAILQEDWRTLVLPSMSFSLLSLIQSQTSEMHVLTAWMTRDLLIGCHCQLKGIVVQRLSHKIVHFVNKASYFACGMRQKKFRYGGIAKKVPECPISKMAAKIAAKYTNIHISASRWARIFIEVSTIMFLGTTNSFLLFLWS